MEVTIHEFRRCGIKSHTAFLQKYCPVPQEGIVIYFFRLSYFFQENSYIFIESFTLLCEVLGAKTVPLDQNFTVVKHHRSLALSKDYIPHGCGRVKKFNLELFSPPSNGNFNLQIKSSFLMVAEVLLLRDPSPPILLQNKFCT